MAFFDDLSKKVGKAAQVAAKKSSELVEITKLNAHISSTEDNIKANYRKMGEICFELFGKGENLNAEIVELCHGIVDYQDQITELKAKIEAIKNDDGSAVTKAPMQDVTPAENKTSEAAASTEESSSINLDK